MVLVSMLGSRGSKKMTVLLQPPPSLLRPDPPHNLSHQEEGGRRSAAPVAGHHPSLRGNRSCKECTKIQCQWTARAIRKENRRQKGNAQRGGENPAISTNISGEGK